MNYYRKLYEATAWLLMLQTEMKEYPFSVVAARFIDDSRGSWDDPLNRGVDSIAVLLALERNGEPMPEEVISLLERNISEVAAERFPEDDRAAVIDDLKTAKGVVQWYRGR